MVRAMWMVLPFLALAAAARYSDYSGGKMPQYGTGGGIEYESFRYQPLAVSNDYPNNDHDMPTNLEYKDEEDSVKIKAKEQEDSVELQKSIINHRKSLDDPNFESAHKFNSEEQVPKLKSSNRIPKDWLPRAKKRRYSRDNIVKRLIRHGRYNNEDVSDINRNVERNVGSHGEKHVDRNVDELQEDEDDKINYKRRVTTSRPVRRKPRDRFMPESYMEEEDHMNDKVLEKRIKDHNLRSDDYSGVEDRPRPQLRSGSSVIDDSEPRPIRKHSDNDNDYYDMKRVQDIREKLPALIRRTTTIQRARADVRNQRMMAPIPISSDPDVEATESNKSDVESGIEIFYTKLSSTSADDSHIVFSTIIPAVTASVVFTTVPVSFSKRMFLRDGPKNVTLSYAERSRLSILKKAQRKETVKGEMTVMPPVLMQVSQKVHTLVLVEPPTSELPWKRARVVSGDTPEQLKQVKRMMRRKLVNNAKDIHELTKNWDDMVCDYVDVSLLKNHGIAILFQNTISTAIVPVLSCYRTFN